MGTVSGFRHTGAASEGGARGRTHIVADIVDDLTRGRSVAQIAQERGLPRAFVEQVVDHARRQGTIDIVELTSGCAGGACAPDPDSPVCAGCPLLPASARNRASIVSHIRRLIQTHT